MKLKDLAYALGISPSMVSRLAKRGMPVTSIADAEKWRKKNIDPSYMKQNRVRTKEAAKVPKRHDDLVTEKELIRAMWGEETPRHVFNPMQIAGALGLTGIHVSGWQVFALTNTLFGFYNETLMKSFGIPAACPDSLKLRPPSPEFDRLLSDLSKRVGEAIEFGINFRAKEMSEP